MPKCRTGCLVLHVVRIFGVWRIPPAVIEAEVKFKWILKQTCFSRSEFFKEQTRQSKLWSVPGILVVFLMCSAVKRFQGYWFYFFFNFLALYTFFFLFVWKRHWHVSAHFIQVAGSLCCMWFGRCCLTASPRHYHISVSQMKMLVRHWSSCSWGQSMSVHDQPCIWAHKADWTR